MKKRLNIVFVMIVIFSIMPFSKGVEPPPIPPAGERVYPQSYSFYDYETADGDPLSNLLPSDGLSWGFSADYNEYLGQTAYRFSITFEFDKERPVDELIRFRVDDGPSNHIYSCRVYYLKKFLWFWATESKWITIQFDENGFIDLGANYQIVYVKIEYNLNGQYHPQYDNHFEVPYLYFYV